MIGKKQQRCSQRGTTIHPLLQWTCTGTKHLWRFLCSQDVQLFIGFIVAVKKACDVLFPSKPLEGVSYGI